MARKSFAMAEAATERSPRKYQDQPMPHIEFWYEFASTYSYLSAMRIDEEALKRGITVRWKPFLLGPIFKAQGWDTSPFNLYPSKGRYMQRDIERICEMRGLPPFKLPNPFPQNALNAARLALIGEAEGWAPAFSRELYIAQFTDNADISDPAILTKTLNAIGQEAEALMPRIQAPEIKEQLKLRSAEAARLGIFGAPSFITEDGELFWGDDRLEQALFWASNKLR